MPITIYKVDHNRVFNGKTHVLTDRDPVFPNSITVAPPDTEGFHIWDGTKWFTRAEYPQPVQPEPPRQNILPRREFRARFTLQERVALEERKAEDAVIRVFVADMDAGETVDIDDPQVMEGIHYLQQVGILDADRVPEILG